MELSKDFTEFIVLLNKHNVEYLVVGGFAVGFHGYPRFTGDFDVWINVSDENADKMIGVVKDFGVGFLFEKKDFVQENFVGQIGYPPLRIDILTNIDGVTFEECFKEKVEFEAEEGLKLNFIHYNHLIKNKLASGRPKDIIDAERIKKLKNKK